jgi:hypothetical protein
MEMIDIEKNTCTHAELVNHEYYLRLEEETKMLKFQLQQKDIQRALEVEQTIISQFSVNTECVYIGKINNTNENGEKLLKFGHTNDLQHRVFHHRKTYLNFVLVNAFRVHNKVEIENLIKKSPMIKPHIRTIKVAEKNKTEIIAYNDEVFTIEHLTKYIKDIIQSKAYSIENFNKLVKENEEIISECNDLREKVNELSQTNLELTIEIVELKEKLEKQDKVIASVNQIETHSVYENVLLMEDELNKKFNEFVSTICIVRPDVEELSVNIEGRYRIWSKVKPSKEVFHALKHYMDTRFKPKRIQGGNHGYAGIKLKNVEYKKSLVNSDVETFVFQGCQFLDCGKILNSVLLREYQKWKLSVGKQLSDDDMKDMKSYLNECPYALKATVWTEEGNNEGYYGLSLRKTGYAPKFISSTGKKVFKREKSTNNLLCSWDTIAKAAQAEGVSTAKMSRYVKAQTVVDDIYYATA